MSFPEIHIFHVINLRLGNRCRFTSYMPFLQYMSFMLNTCLYTREKMKKKKLQEKVKMEHVRNLHAVSAFLKVSYVRNLHAVSAFLKESYVCNLHAVSAFLKVSNVRSLHAVSAFLKVSNVRNLHAVSAFWKASNVRNLHAVSAFLKVGIARITLLFSETY